jgi:hypothetical protein
MAVNTQLQVRRGSASQWTSANPTLAAGEFGFESDTGKFKIGTGSTAWTSLAYASLTSSDIPELSQDAIDSALTAGTGITKTYNDGANTLTLAVDTTTIQARISGVSDTEIGYLTNVTSDIQTQLDGKVDESIFDTKGDILVASADNTPAKLAAGTNGYLLTANSAATNGIEWAAAPVSLPSQTGNTGKYLTTDGSTATWGAITTDPMPQIFMLMGV